MIKTKSAANSQANSFIVRKSLKVVYAKLIVTASDKLNGDVALICNLCYTQAIVIRIPEVPFRVFDKLKNEIQIFMVRFCIYLNMKNDTQMTDYYCYVKLDFYFEFLMLSFVFYSHKKWRMKYSLFFVFHYHE